MSKQKVVTTTNDTWYQETKVSSPNFKTPVISNMTMETEYKGAFEGVSVGNYAMAAFTDKPIPEGKTEGDDWTFTGIATFDGSVVGRKGTFAVRCVGFVRDGWSGATNTIVPGTGTGELKGLTGEGSFKIQMGPEGCPKDMPIEWEIAFEDK